MPTATPSAVAKSAATPAPGADSWRRYTGPVPMMLTRMCMGPEVTRGMFRKAMIGAANFKPEESRLSEDMPKGVWRDAIVCGWDVTNRILFLIPNFHAEDENMVAVCVKGDVTDVNVQVALNTLAQGLARVACGQLRQK